MNVVVNVFEPTSPFSHLASSRVASIDYGFQLGRATPVGFLISRDTVTQPHLWKKGSLVSIERDDGLLEWAGYIVQRDLALGDAGVEITAVEFAGSLLEGTLTPTTWREHRASSSFLIYEAIAHASGVGEPPPIVELATDTLGGPPISYTFKGESLLKFLTALTKATGWEWRIEPQMRHRTPRIALYWAERQGTDQRSSHVFTEGYHFVNARLEEDASAALSRSVVSGGDAAPFSSRPTSVVSASGNLGGERDVIGERRVALGREIRPVVASPALNRARLQLLQEVSDRETITQSAREMHTQTDAEVEESISVELFEDSIRMSELRLGDVYGVRFDDLSLGLGVERAFRVIAIRLGTDGIVELVGPVQRDVAAGSLVNRAA